MRGAASVRALRNGADVTGEAFACASNGPVYAHALEDGEKLLRL